MEIAQTQSGLGLWSMLRSFTIWSFTLIVCLLVVGFPLVAIVAAAAAILAVALQAVLPISAVLVVGGGVLGGSLLGVFLLAAALSLRGIHPQDVSWLSWLQEAEGVATAIYASCPLTCEIDCSSAR